MNSAFLRAILAALPLLGLMTGWRDGFRYGAAAFFIVGVSCLIFLETRPLLPKKARQPFLLFVLLALGIAAGRLFSLSSLLLPALILLSPPEEARSVKQGTTVFKIAVSGAAALVLLLLAHGAAYEFLGLGLGWEFFQLPAGSFLFLGGLFFLGGKK